MEDFKGKLGCFFVFFLIGFVVYYLWTRGTKTERTTIDRFKIKKYEFVVKYVVKTDKSTGEIKKEYYDTILWNNCDFCKECEEDYEPIRR